MKTPRDYQEEAIQSTFDYFGAKDGNPLIIAPTGAGKSLLIGEFLHRACKAYPETRALVMAHNKELLVQNEAALKEQYPEASTGFYCAGLGKKNMYAPITFASIQSIFRKIDKFKPFDLILVDECHLISTDDDTMYQKVLSVMRDKNPHVKCIGYTATPYRADSGCIVEAGIFDDIAYEIEVQYLIDQGYLSKPITPEVETKMDTTGVGTRKGDYIESQLQKAVDKDEVTEACVKEIIEHGKDRRCWLVFTAGVEHCKNVTACLQYYGVNAEYLTGQTPKEERADIIERYKNGEIKCLVNVAVLTTGFDNPMIDLLAFMRPTKSPVLYVQATGRGMRICDGKENVMVLDFGGVIDELGPIDLVNKSVTGRGKTEDDGEAPVKQCPQCYSYAHTAQKECEECGYEFVSDDGPAVSKNSAKGKAVLASDIEPENMKVMSVAYDAHNKPDKPSSLKVSYFTMGGIRREWICFEHEGFARRKAEQWHKARSQEPIPDTAEQALRIKYLEPTEIDVLPDGKYFKIVGYTFPTEEQKKEEEYEIPF